MNNPGQACTTTRLSHEALKGKLFFQFAKQNPDHKPDPE